MMTTELFSQYLKSNIPIADVAGINLENLSNTEAQISVSLNLMTQNPFKSMFWAIQGMAAEFSTGVLCMSKISESKKNISILVVKQEAIFTKKAIGKILFTCKQGKEIEAVIQKAIETKEGQTILVTSQGKDEEGDIVSSFQFTWSFKIKE